VLVAKRNAPMNTFTMPRTVVAMIPIVARRRAKVGRADVVVFFDDDRPSRRGNLFGGDKRLVLQGVDDHVAHALLLEVNHVLSGRRLDHAMRLDVGDDYLVAQTGLSHRDDIFQPSRSGKPSSHPLFDDRIVPRNILVNALADCVAGNHSHGPSDECSGKRIVVVFADGSTNGRPAQSSNCSSLIGVTRFRVRR